MPDDARSPRPEAAATEVSASPDEDGSFDDDDDDRRDVDSGDARDDEITQIALVERLSQVESWEMYRVIDQDSGMPVASIGVEMPSGPSQSVQYAVWRQDEREEPGATGYVQRHGPSRGVWDDRAREAALRQVMHRTAACPKTPPDKLAFCFEAPESNIFEPASTEA